MSALSAPRLRWIPLLWGLLLSSPVVSPAQPDWGVTYWPPEDTLTAIRDLHAIREAGFRWVELLRPVEPTLLRWCERLGLRVLYRLVETDRPGPQLRRALERLRTELIQNLERARPYSCIAAWGLGGPDAVWDPDARWVQTALAEEVTRRDSRPIYRLADPSLGALPGGWVIWDLTDSGLGDLKEPPSPAGMVRIGRPAQGLERWPHVRATPERAWMGLWTDLRGIDSLQRPPQIVWIHTWRDYRDLRPRVRLTGVDPWWRPYGLVAANGMPRPALEGVLARLRGEPLPDPSPDDSPPLNPWLPVLWGVLVALGLYYHYSPRFRRMLGRYVRAHRFFIEDLVRLRERPEYWAWRGMPVLAISAGLFALLGYTQLQEQTALHRLLGFLEEAPLGHALLSAIGRRPELVAAAGSVVYLLDHGLWLALLRWGLQREWRPPVQVLGALLALAHWPLAALALLGLLAATLGWHAETLWAGLGGLWMLLFAAGRMQAVVDAALPTRLPLPIVLLASLGLPLALYGLLGGLLWNVFDLGSHLVYFWRSL
ncbi:MAG: hypothetical protein RMK61_08955 [Bacteroidota bacterium]|nr:hypothetical protein [Bacteroidota bacterium]